MGLIWSRISTGFNIDVIFHWISDWPRWPMSSTQIPFCSLCWTMNAPWGNFRQSACPPLYCPFVLHTFFSVHLNMPQHGFPSCLQTRTHEWGGGQRALAVLLRSQSITQLRRVRRLLCPDWTIECPLQTLLCSTYWEAFLIVWMFIF